MGEYIFRRLLITIFMMFFLSVLIFFLMQIVLGDPVVLMLGRDADPETIAHLRAQLGFNRPIYVQYVDWLSHLLQGDWGESFRNTQSVAEAIWQRLPVTLELTTLALLLALLLALCLGILAATHPRTKLDLSISFLTGLGIAMPNFWIGILLIFFFALQLKWLPSSGYVSFWESPLENLLRMILPTLTLSAAYFSNLARITRTKMLEVLEGDYIRTARAKGLPEGRVIWVHALKNSLIPILTILGVNISRLFGGAVVTETIFALPGIGRLLVDSILGRDFPVVQGVIIMVTVGVFLTNLTVDIAYALIDPQVRYGKSA